MQNGDVSSIHETTTKCEITTGSTILHLFNLIHLIRYSSFFQNIFCLTIHLSFVNHEPSSPRPPLAFPKRRRWHPLRSCDNRCWYINGSQEFLAWTFIYHLYHYPTNLMNHLSNQTWFMMEMENRLSLSEMDESLMLHVWFEGNKNRGGMMRINSENQTTKPHPYH